MRAPKADEMLYPELFRAFERVRWDLDKDINWQELFSQNPGADYKNECHHRVGSPSCD